MNRFFLLLLGVCLLASCARDFLSGNAPAAAGAARHAKLQISTTSLPTGTVGSSYSATLVATGGTTPYTWSLTSGTLPTGLQLNASTGAINYNGFATIGNTVSTPRYFQVGGYLRF